MDLVLAIAHHLAVFGLAAVLGAEFFLVRRDMTAAAVRAIARIDIAFGGLAGLALVVGLLRVFLGDKGSAYYFGNAYFWAKIGAFAVVGVLSIGPTRRFVAWARGIRGEAQRLPQPGEVDTVRRFLWLEAGIFVLIPTFAAIMARSPGP